MYAVKKPRNITHKGLTDLVTDTDKKSEATILEVVIKNFVYHLILGEVGRITGEVEFVGGPMCWNTRILSASAGGGAFCNGQKIYVSQTDEIIEEAGGKVTCMDGGKFSVFDRSVLVSKDVLHGKLLERIAPATEKLQSKGTSPKVTQQIFDAPDSSFYRE